MKSPNPVILPGYDLDGPKHYAMLREVLRSNGIAYDKVMMKERTDEAFLLGRHHLVIDSVLEKVLSGEITRLIINIPPGYTKTEKAVINFISRGFAINPRARFLHSSYSFDLAALNSTKVKDTINTPLYQELYGIQLSKDSKAKNMWKLKQGGSLYAAAAGGSITGFRAGTMETDLFTGALIIDDPLKPTDALSATEREKVNFRYNNTFASRLAHQGVPVIVIMQRLHPNDLSGHLLTGGSGEKWHHLMLPISIEENFEYPKKFTHGIYIDHGLEPGPLWKKKHDEEQIKILEAADKITFYSQYEQNPQADGNNIVKSTYFREYDSLDEFMIDQLYILVDTAEKTREHNDFSSFSLIGSGTNLTTGKRADVLMDNLHCKLESPELLKEAKRLIEKWQYNYKNRDYGVHDIYIEAKSSGTGLIQHLERENKITVHAIERTNKDRMVRLGGILPQWSENPLWVPKPQSAPWIEDFMQECFDFRADDSHDHDDRLDNVIDYFEIVENEFKY